METQDYRTTHLGAGKAADYDSGFFQPGTLKHLEWDLERRLLQRTVARLRPGRVLDFACGTGRVLQFWQLQGVTPTGLDVSPDMLALAQEKVPNARRFRADVTHGPDPLAGEQFDVISAFRFFLNAEPELRAAVLAWMRGHLRPDGRLVANFHLNPRSSRGAYLRARRLKGQPMLSQEEVVELLGTAGFELEELVGYSFLPFRRDGARLLAPAHRLRFEHAVISRGWSPRRAGSFYVVARPA